MKRVCILAFCLVLLIITNNSLAEEKIVSRESYVRLNKNALRLIVSVEELGVELPGLPDNKGTFESKLYKYKFIFKNEGVHELKVHFNSGFVLQSPVIEIAQDFSWTVKAGKAKEFCFIARGKPVEFPASIQIAWKEKGRWKSFIGGSATVFLPPLYTDHYLEVE